MITTGAFNLSIEVGLPFEQARERAIAVLKEQGFGVLTEIDVKATMKQKLDVDFRRYAILGFCNPPLAHRALEAEPNVGVLLPCNVVVYEKDAMRSAVVTIDPEVQLGKIGSPELAEVAGEVKRRFVKALEEISASAS